MYFKKHIQINALLFIIVFSLIPVSGKSDGNEENAIKLFHSKQYEKALPLFSELLKLYPTDTTLCYYTGVCLTETNRFNDEAINFLLFASKGNVPVDVNYFIGKNYHALNNFEQALTYYNLFNKIAKSKEVKTLGLKEKLTMCSNRINPFTNLNSTLKEGVIKNSLATQNTSVEPNDENQAINDSIAFDSTLTEGEIFEIPDTLNNLLINFNITSEISYLKVNQFKTTDGKGYFVEGWKKSEELKKLIFETDSLRNEYSHTNFSDQKAIISTRVIELESQTINTKSVSDLNYIKAREFEVNYWSQATENEKWKWIDENDSIKSFEEKKILSEIAKAIITDTITDMIVQDTIPIDSTKIQVDITLSEPPQNGIIIFKVQIGAYNTELPESAKKLYKKISILRKIDQFIDERNYTIYTIGELTNIKDAVKLQEQIRQESIKDAFIIAYKDGKRIPLNEALVSKKQ